MNFSLNLTLTLNLTFSGSWKGNAPLKPFNFGWNVIIVNMVWKSLFANKQIKLFLYINTEKALFLYITYIRAQYFNPCRFDCKYKITEYFQNYLAHSKLSPFHFHLKICDFQKKIDNFHILLNEFNITWDVIAITTWCITGAGEVGEQGGPWPPQ